MAEINPENFETKLYSTLYCEDFLNEFENRLKIKI